MGKNDNANSMGVLNLIDPPYKDINNAESIITEGTDIIMVVIIKKLLMVVPIPVKNIW